MIFIIGTIYVANFKEIMPNKLKLKTAIYFSLITLAIYFLNYTQHYSMELGDNLINGKYKLLSVYSFITLFINNIYFDTYVAITFIRYASAYAFLDIPGKVYFYLINRKNK